MTNITLPEQRVRRLTFYLAMEEYLARETTLDDCFFVWQVPPTVIFGRNQLIDSEVDIDYCRTHGIQTYRRKSGGGCVYADMGNIMSSFVCRDENVGRTYNRYINMMLWALHHMGIEAKATGRNDILIDGRKVSGTAFYHLPGASIVHGTLLYDTQMEHMTASITPSDAKLTSKGVSSVRQHITLLKDHTTLSISEVMHVLTDRLCHGSLCLDAAAVERIEQIEQGYLTDTFIRGHNPRHTVVRKAHIEGVGDLEVNMEVRNDTIRDIRLIGDFLTPGQPEEIETRLRGTHLDPESLDKALPHPLGDIILHLRKEDLIRLILNT